MLNAPTQTLPPEGGREGFDRLHRYRLTRPDSADPICLGNLTQSGHVALEGSPTLLGEREPRPGPLADVTLVHFDVARLLHRAHLLGQNRVGDLHVIPDEAELDLAGRRQQGCDREPHRMTEEVGELVARMAQRRKISQAAMSSGTEPTSSLIPK